MTTLELDPFGAEVCRVLQQRGFQPYPVGGYVRDLLLARKPVDVDLMVERDAQRAARLLADALGGAYYPLHEEADLARVVLKREDGRYIVDIARQQGRTLLEDLSQRDFTINAMALDLSTGEVVDPFHGRRDLERRRVRMLRPEVFLDDPVRLLRAPRFCAQLNFELDEETEAALSTFASLITRSPAERIRDELVRLMRTKDVATWLDFMMKVGLLEHVLPPVRDLQGVPQGKPHYLPLYEHTLETVRITMWLLALLDGTVTPQTEVEQAVADVILPWRDRLLEHLDEELTATRTHRDFLPWGALAHDWGKAKTYRLDERGRIVFHNHERVGAAITADTMRALRFARREVEHMVTLVRHHMRPFALVRQIVRDRQETPSRRAVYRFFRDTGDASIDVLLINLADDWATYGPRLRKGYWHKRLQVLPHMFDAYFNHPHEVVRPRPILRGRELMDIFGLEPGPLLGRLLNSLVEAQAAGEVRTRAQALRWVENRLKAEASKDGNRGDEETTEQEESEEALPQ